MESNPACSHLSRKLLSTMFEQFTKVKNKVTVNTLKEYGFDLVASIPIEDKGKMKYRLLPSLKSAYLQGKSGILAVFHNNNMCFVSCGMFSATHSKHIFSVTSRNDKFILGFKFSDSRELIYKVSSKKVTKKVRTHTDKTDANFDDYDGTFIKTLDKLAADGLAVSSISLPDMDEIHCCNDDECPRRVSFDDAIYAFNNEMNINIRHKFIIDGQEYRHLSINICDFTMRFYNHTDDYVCELYSGRVNVESPIMKLVEEKIINDARSMCSDVFDVEESFDTSNMILIPGMTSEEVLKSYADYSGYETMSYDGHISCMLEGRYVPHLPIVIIRSSPIIALVFRDSKGRHTMSVLCYISKDGITLLKSELL